MASYDKGKQEAVNWIYLNINPSDGVILDVGPGDGKWYDLLGKYYEMEAIEASYETIVRNDLHHKYKAVWCGKIQESIIPDNTYSLIIFGDVLEHLSVEDAQKVIAYAYPRCDNMLIAVPFLYEQGEINGNPYEKHLQPDLTHEIFMERYKGFKPLILFPDYGYYVKE